MHSNDARGDPCEEDSAQLEVHFGLKTWTADESKIIPSSCCTIFALGVASESILGVLILRSGLLLNQRLYWLFNIRLLCRHLYDTTFSSFAITLVQPCSFRHHVLLLAACASLAR